MTNWVTIKVPERTRDKAQEDPRTYEEIMKAGLVESEPVGEITPEIEALRKEVGNEVGGCGLDEDAIRQLANSVTSEIQSEARINEIAREVWRQADEAMLERVVRNVLQSELGGR